MTSCAIANVLHDGRMRARFHAEPMVQAAELLLQERTPRDVSVAHPRAEEVGSGARISDEPGLVGAPTAHPARCHTADASAIQRALQRDADRCGFGLQPLGRSGA